MFTKFGFGEIILHTYMGREGLGSSYWTAWLRQVHGSVKQTVQDSKYIWLIIFSPNRELDNTSLLYRCYYYN